VAERRDLQGLLERIDAFIERELVPLEAEHLEFFDHRREFARTDLERGGAPVREWEELLVEMMRRADAAGLYRFALPAELGGSDGFWPAPGSSASGPSRPIPRAPRSSTTPGGRPISPG